ncbi:hypothetical protein EPD60_03785 [Flaviaesturariibacter flavus]|uniref:Uncharacterized protein n=1 Tax=Flaviaesturariibacter flavus TaxID=2502780 RepID=A0A4R1BMC4_9BACT|nr:hypothetical protein [Flaviaesturariibacter flavus]TCJ18631.1 hypothetical protein EPD60_03785 [Flaviaesturariibacter flavus]
MTNPSSFDLSPGTAAQGLALNAGKGRAVVLGEAALLGAQLNRDGSKVGMNYNPGNRQLALNLLHWLAGE